MFFKNLISGSGTPSRSGFVVFDLAFSHYTSRSPVYLFKRIAARPMVRLITTIATVMVVSLPSPSLFGGGRPEIRSATAIYRNARFDCIDRGIVVAFKDASGKDRRVRIKLLNLNESDRELFLIGDLRLRSGQIIKCIQLIQITDKALIYQERGNFGRDKVHYITWDRISDKLKKRFGRN